MTKYELIYNIKNLPFYWELRKQNGSNVGHFQTNIEAVHYFISLLRVSELKIQDIKKTFISSINSTYDFDSGKFIYTINFLLANKIERRNYLNQIKRDLYDKYLIDPITLADLVSIKNQRRIDKIRNTFIITKLINGKEEQSLFTYNKNKISIESQKELDHLFTKNIYKTRDLIEEDAQQKNIHITSILPSMSNIPNLKPRQRISVSDVTEIQNPVLDNVENNNKIKIDLTPKPKQRVESTSVQSNELDYANYQIQNHSNFVNRKYFKKKNFTKFINNPFFKANEKNKNIHNSNEFDSSEEIKLNFKTENEISSKKLFNFELSPNIQNTKPQKIIMQSNQENNIGHHSIIEQKIKSNLNKQLDHDPNHYKLELNNSGFDHIANKQNIHNLASKFSSKLNSHLMNIEKSDFKDYVIQSGIPAAKLASTQEFLVANTFKSYLQQTYYEPAFENTLKDNTEQLERDQNQIQEFDSMQELYNTLPCIKRSNHSFAFMRKQNSISKKIGIINTINKTLLCNKNFQFQDMNQKLGLDNFDFYNRLETKHNTPEGKKIEEPQRKQYQLKNDFMQSGFSSPPLIYNDLNDKFLEQNMNIDPINVQVMSNDELSEQILLTRGQIQLVKEQRLRELDYQKTQEFESFMYNANHEMVQMSTEKDLLRQQTAVPASNSQPQVHPMNQAEFIPNFWQQNNFDPYNQKHNIYDNPQYNVYGQQALILNNPTVIQQPWGVYTQISHRPVYENGILKGYMETEEVIKPYIQTVAAQNPHETQEVAFDRMNNFYKG